MYKILLLLAGGGIGTVSRYLISSHTHKIYLGTFPLGTLTVNVLGSFAIGFLWGLFESENMSQGMRAFLFIGLLGGFTTFSSYALESYNLFKDGEIKMAIINVLANNILAIVMVILGLILARSINGLIQ
jgi:CrcB protein